MWAFFVNSCSSGHSPLAGSDQYGTGFWTFIKAEHVWSS